MQSQIIVNEETSSVELADRESVFAQDALEAERDAVLEQEAILEQEKADQDATAPDCYGRPAHRRPCSDFRKGELRFEQAQRAWERLKEQYGSARACAMLNVQTIYEAYSALSRACGAPQLTVGAW